MPATISMEEGMALMALAELLRYPARFHCRFECPNPPEDYAGANDIVAGALAIIDDLPAKHPRFPRS